MMEKMNEKGMDISLIQKWRFKKKYKWEVDDRYEVKSFASFLTHFCLMLKICTQIGNDSNEERQQRKKLYGQRLLKKNEPIVHSLKWIQSKMDLPLLYKIKWIYLKQFVMLWMVSRLGKCRELNEMDVLDCKKLTAEKEQTKGIFFVFAKLG